MRPGQRRQSLCCLETQNAPWHNATWRHWWSPSDIFIERKIEHPVLQLAKTTRGSCTSHALRLLSIIIIIIIINIIILIIIIIIIKIAIYSNGDIFLSISQITRIADNTRRAGESYGMKERLQETPIQYTQWRHYKQGLLQTKPDATWPRKALRHFV